MNRAELLNYLSVNNLLEHNQIEISNKNLESLSIPMLQSDFILKIMSSDSPELYDSSVTTPNLGPVSQKKELNTVHAKENKNLFRGYILQEFNIPDVGFAMKEDSSRLGFVMPELKYDTLKIEYIVPSVAEGSNTSNSGQVYSNNIGFAWYNRQFDDSGLVNYASYKDGDVVRELKMSALLLLYDIKLIRFERVRFSRPLPVASQKSNNFIVYKQELSFNNYNFLL